MKRGLYFLERVASSRAGHALLILHLSLVVFDFAQKTPVSRAESNVVYKAGEIMPSSLLLAGRSFHWHYESALLRLLVFVDMPGLLLSFLFGLILAPLSYILPPLGAYDDSWFVAGLFLVGASIQWQFIGYLLGRLAWSGKKEE